MKKEGGLTYKAALMLKTAILERPSDAPLPAQFEIGNMTTFIADSNADASDDEFETDTRQHTWLLKATILDAHRDQHKHNQVRNHPREGAPSTLDQSAHTDTTKGASLSTITSNLN